MSMTSLIVSNSPTEQTSGRIFNLVWRPAGRFTRGVDLETTLAVSTPVVERLELSVFPSLLLIFPASALPAGITEDP